MRTTVKYIPIVVKIRVHCGEAEADEQLRGAALLRDREPEGLRQPPTNTRKGASKLVAPNKPLLATSECRSSRKLVCDNGEISPAVIGDVL